MKLIFSDRSNMPEGIFSVLNAKKNELLAAGRTVYNFSVGTPDFAPPAHIMEAMKEACGNPENYKYALADRPELLQAVSDFYRSRFGVELATDQIMSMYGSQEGMAHIALALCDPGDTVLVPNPGYPVFGAGPELMGAKLETYPLYRENNFLPDFQDIPEESARRAKFMILSYPANPVCSVADDDFYRRAIAFAKEYNVMLLHDNAYADIVFGGREGKSFLSYEGAMDVGIEFYSLSKSYNMTGMRISFALGNREIIARFRNVRSQIDYGIFLPIQKAAIAALTGPQDSVKEQCRAYEERCRALCRGLTSIGWEVPDGQGTMFVWAPIPKNFSSSEKFVIELMERTGVIVTPGTAFGSLGEGYVRMALVYPVETIESVVRLIDGSGILRS
ncbi:MAG: aminotransferase class I/II-fold pyridoxal phosphate-dependent enzyme [Lachnospiraceae bacterium]|nr:aminotransferase class I/II-fold pyridoxal phosphate-dependent enzyme [Lachnospiraceae bacterium]